MSYLLLFLNFTINWLLITCIVGITIGSFYPAVSWATVIVTSTCILILSVIFFLSDLGSGFLVAMIPHRTPSEPEIRYLKPILKEVFDKTQLKKRPIVFIQDDKYPNAMALANAIIITTGLLKIASKEELTAVIAHEAGHIVNGDVKLKTLHFAVNKMGNVMLILAIGLIMFFSANGRRFYIYLPFIILAAVLKILYWVLDKTLQLGILSCDRKNEYRADSFAASIGYKEPIVSYLKKVAEITKDKKSIFSTHPTLISRIAKIEA